jgi:hypothetical protein
MADFRDKLRELDRIEPPEEWSDVERLGPRIPNEPCRGQKPQSWAGPAVSPGRQRRVSSFLGSREAGFGLRSRFGLLVGPRSIRRAEPSWRGLEC